MANTHSKSRRRKAAQNPIPKLVISLPKFKKDMSMPRREVQKIHKDVAKGNLVEAFDQKLRTIIKSIKVTDNPNKSGKEKEKDKTKIDKALQKKKIELANAKSVLRGTWELADQIGIKKRQHKQVRYGTKFSRYRE